MRRGLGVNITNDMVNEFFSPKPISLTNPSQNNASKYKYEKHSVGTSSFGSSRAVSGIATPRYSADEVRFYEQQMTLSSHYENDDYMSASAPIPISEMLLPEPDDSPSTLPEKEQHIATEIYDNYCFEHSYDNTLPITDERQRVVQTIESNRVTIIQGSTGSGKTTQVPQYILDYYKCSGKYCNILVTQPRRIAAISVAKRVSQERSWQLGTLVGYQVARERSISEDTRITYVTTGVLLQKMIKNKSLGEYTHIILDEVHERDQDIDFCMLVVRKFLRNISRHVKVVLMSATVDCSLFSNYFSILVNGRQEGAPVIRVDGKMFDVREYYFEDISGLSEPPQQSIYEPGISSECYRLCRELIMGLDKDEFDEDELHQGKMAENRGTVLCFLPGLPEIKEMHKYLVDIEEKLKLKVIPLHSLITTVEQNKVFIPAAPFERKVILSTNIAESSITVPDIKYVIDFCLTKQNETDPDTNYQRLTLQWASQASLTQRKGRAGRVSEGHCFRMISSSMYPQLFEYCLPEMLRAPLEQIVLQVKLLELGPPAMILQLAIQPPNLSDVKRTVLMLKEVGALTVRQNGKINPLDGDLTFIGRVLGTLPVDVRIGKLLLMGYAFGVVEECTIIGACLSLKSIFAQPFRMELKSYSNKMHWARYSNSDLLASLNAFLSWKVRKEHRGFGEPEKNWAKRNMLEGRRFNEVNELARELRERLFSFNVQSHRNIFHRDEISKDDELLLKLLIAGAFYPNYFQTGHIDETEATKTMSGQNPFTTVVVSGAPPTLCHYRLKVAQLFRQCGRGKRLFFENSRAFIEFESDNSGESPVAAAVYKAMKMRHLRIPLNIHVSKKKDEEFRTELADNPLVAYNPETGLRTNRVNTQLSGKQAKFSVTMVGDPKRVEIKKSGYIPIFVQEIVSPGQFWVTYADTETRQLMFQMYNKLNSLDGRNLKPLRKEDIYVGAYCLAPFEDEFYRSEIIMCTESCVQVHYLDYGNKHLVPRHLLRCCPESLLEIPFQAFMCELCELRPIRGTWSEEAHERFKEYVPIASVEFIAKIYSVVHDTCRIELFNSDDISINRLLIEEGHAAPQQETLVSKNMHEMVESKKEVQSTEKIIVDSSADLSADEEVLKINLRGPFSPYEMSFHGLTASSRLRSTRIEQDSVNSVVMCEEPQDRTNRLLVAAVININSSGNAMIARETTLYPNIHGLNALIPLLFAPVAELRCDKNKTMYTGALCGLGYTGRNTPILPDHDMEVTFDVKFTENDLFMINVIRMLINSAIGIEEEKIDKSHNKMVEIQKTLKDKLMKLVTMPRTDMEPRMFRREYQWNQIEDDYLLETGYDSKPAHLYMYHKGIFFEEQHEPEDPRIVEQRRQLENLHKLAGESLIPFKTEVVCCVCQVVCRHPRAVYIHCDTPQHRNWVKTLFKS